MAIFLFLKFPVSLSHRLPISIVFLGFFRASAKLNFHWNDSVPIISPWQCLVTRFSGGPAWLPEAVGAFITMTQRLWVSRWPTHRLRDVIDLFIFRGRTGSDPTSRKVAGLSVFGRRKRPSRSLESRARNSHSSTNQLTTTTYFKRSNKYLNK